MHQFGLTGTGKFSSRMEVRDGSMGFDLAGIEDQSLNAHKFGIAQQKLRLYQNRTVY